MGACKGDCRDNLGKLTVLRKTIAQGFVRCTNCNYWMDWKFCHLKNNTPALPDSLGMFCNCCNYRVRQQPRSKRSKDILKNAKLDSKKSQTNLRNQMASATTIEESREIIQKIKDEIESRKKVQKNKPIKKPKIVWNEQKQDWDVIKITDEEYSNQNFYTSNPNLSKSKSGNNEQSVIDTGRTLDELRELFEENFSNDPQLLKQFERLEKYLTLLPNNKKYEDVNYFIH